ncbi:MAG: type II toxin-antitoxin system RelE/ParE family toxin [Methylocella sp.]
MLHVTSMHYFLSQKWHKDYTGPVMKLVHWVGSSLRDLNDFPEEVKSEAGFALFVAQKGGKAVNAVPMVGFNGATVLEVVIDHDTNTFRAVYTVKFGKAVYVLHAFQKKSVKGRATPRPDILLIKSRLKLAEEDYAARYLESGRRGTSHGKGA